MKPPLEEFVRRCFDSVRMKLRLFILCLVSSFALAGSSTAADSPNVESVSPAFDAASLEVLTKGVRQIAAPGVPGTLCVFGDKAFPVVLGRAGRDALEPAVAAAQFGRGRIVAFGHDGFFAPEALKQLDTQLFLENCLAWAASGKEKPRVAVLRDSRLARHLADRGLKVVPADLAALKDVDVLIAVGTSFRSEDAERITQFIQDGGGFVTAGTGWGWQQLNPGKELSTELPANRVLAPAGLVFAAGMLDERASKGFAVTSGVPPLTHAGRAFLAAQAQAEGKAQLTKTDLAQASASLVAAAQNLPPGDKLLLPRLEALKTDAQVQRVPSHDKPIAAANLFGRLLLTLEGKALRNQAVDQVKAHSAAQSFPGAVPAGAERIASRVMHINASVPQWHSTGLYAAPGEVVTVAVPETAAHSRLSIRIGTHTDTTWHLPTWSRFPEITRTFKIDAAVTRAANPFGGLVYIEVPRGSNLGEFEARISGAVAAPYYVHGVTSAAEWRQTIRNHPAPWGELETRKVIVTLPSSVLRDLEDPAALMDVWDRILDLEATLAGIPTDRPRPERIVTDEQISAGYMHSGYPIMTFLDQTRNFASRESLLKGNWGIFHELGHNHQAADWTFEGTSEVTCNLFTLYVLEKMCTARDGNYRHATPEGILRNYRKLTAGGAPDFELWKRDPFIALSMYAQLKNEFGWEAFEKVFAAYRQLSDRERPHSDQDKRDQWLTRFSGVVGHNLGPFFKAWGVPVTPAAVEAVAKLPAWMPAGLPR